MKCPYRIKTVQIDCETFVSEGKITRIEHTEYENCLKDDCPFYRDNDTRTEPWCAKADLEMGGDFL